jgi:hypothetical protein
VITVRCCTQFDITATGVLGRYRDNLEVRNHADESTIQDCDTWTRARGQQQNWETMNQIISLRCLPENINPPQRNGDQWQFEFDVPDLSALSLEPKDLAFLIRDADGVPMITDLGENLSPGPVIRARGPDANTVFRVITDKYCSGE